LRLLAQHPAEFFETSQPMPTYLRQAVFPLPAVLVYAVCEAFIRHASWWALIYMIGAYIGLGLWTAATKYILLLFAEKRSWQEVLHITSCAWIALLFAGIPMVGDAIAVILIAFWTYQGLVHYFKMNSGAATAAVALPIVICGFLGSILSLILVGLASLSTVFGCFPTAF
jgi:hypothetical protein